MGLNLIRKRSYCSFFALILCLLVKHGLVQDQQYLLWHKWKKIDSSKRPSTHITTYHFIEWERIIQKGNSAEPVYYLPLLFFIYSA